MNPIDERNLQRLVDGELSDGEIRKILDNANDSAVGWEQIALGFVEDQVWNRAFNRQDSSQASGNDGLASAMSNNPVPKSGIWNVAKPKRRSGPNSRLVMAATVLVALTMGYMVSQIQNRNLPKPLAHIENPSVDSAPRLADGSVDSLNSDGELARHRPDSQLDRRPQMTQADFHLELPEEQLGDLASAGPVAPVPLFTVNSAKQWRRLSEERNQPAISPEMIKHLTGSGYQVEQDINYISGRLVDGRSFVVPVRTIRFLPGQ